MKSMSTTFSGVLFSVVMLFIAGAQAASATPPPREPQVVVESVAQELFALVKAKNAAQTPDEEYFQQVEKVLNDVVNFQFIAGAVMGRDTYSKATPAQRQKFITAFKSGLVKSYAKGIAGYADSNIKLLGVTKDAKNPRRAVVKQEVSDNEVAHKLDYTMMQGKTGEWKLINVVLNGVNLGQSFSGQFKAALKKHNGDVDKVIDSWLTDV